MPNPSPQPTPTRAYVAVGCGWVPSFCVTGMKKKILFAAAFFILFFVGRGLGLLWYNLWWAFDWIPAAPLSRFVFPKSFADYHIIRLEMIFWMTGFIGIVFWVVSRKFTRNTEPIAQQVARGTGYGC